ncbi:hypothetical protein EDB19DRAFT_1667476 [Suillus lakei]|nr:hypothetical protein EDB19DRAFT_1667476 [Suillus lakei]
MSLLTKALIVVLVAAAVVPRGAFAQSSEATCLSSFGWMNNSLTQDPCVVVSYLLNVCTGSFVTPPLSPGWVYVNPSGDACGCSSVTYSMMSACADCQNCSYVSWSSWSSSCSMTSFREYPMDIPIGTRVPNWAYLNVSSGFDPVAAQNAGDLPEAVPTNVQSTVTVTYSTTMSASLSTVPTSSISSSAAATGLSTTSNSTSLNVGAIAGGVVGGTMGAAVIIGLATWFLVKRRRSATFSDIDGGPDNTNPSPTQPKMTQQLRLYVCFL